PQDVYDNPQNLFVAKFLGTPPINVFEGKVEEGKIYIGEDVVMEVNGVDNQEIYIGVRPEGFILKEDGALCCKLENVEVMGRDVSVVSTHPGSVNPVVRSIIDADNKVDSDSEVVRYDLKPHKMFIFNKETEERIYFEVK
ncbi:MAG: ABC transporter ATP-binding protein, partial [Agathobacter sp.]|nr:ABC transporter ATP-binding protein [Agathobacter sp.]